MIQQWSLEDHSWEGSRFQQPECLVKSLQELTGAYILSRDSTQHELFYRSVILNVWISNLFYYDDLAIQVIFLNWAWENRLLLSESAFFAGWKVQHKIAIFSKEKYIWLDKQIRGRITVLVCLFSKLLKLVCVLSRCTEYLCNSACNCFWIINTNVFETRMLYLHSMAGAVEAILAGF